MDLVVHIFRTSASQSKQTDAGLLSAKRHLSAIMMKSPQRARNLAWHAAQIIAVANEVSRLSTGAVPARLIHLCPSAFSSVTDLGVRPNGF